MRTGVALVLLVGPCASLLGADGEADAKPATPIAPVVVGFERIRADSSANLSSPGAILARELGCLECHRNGSAASADRKDWRGPRLDDVVRRSPAAYLRQFLARPHAIEPGTAMPDVLAGWPQAERREAVESIVHFLIACSATSRANALARTATDIDGASSDRGRELYHTIGCVACHEPRQDAADEEFGSSLSPQIPSVPLADLSSKYRPGELARFLLDPLAVRSAGRMPRFGLAPEQAASLELYLASRDALARAQPELELQYDRARAEKGAALFSSLGCGNCHRWPTSELDTGPARRAPALPQATLDVATSCLSSQPARGRPFYSLDEAQRGALEAWLREGAPPDDDGVAATLLRLNCIACHEREAVGEPDRGRRAGFTSLGEHDIGPEGRFPPPLTHAGFKLRREAIEAIVAHGDRARPYLATRMPAFGERNARRIAALLEARDLPQPLEPIERVGRNMWGRALVGTEGLSCITCHDLRGRDSLGIPGIDLALSYRRLRPQWFREYLIDPARFRSGTRMPTFWPEGMPVVSEPVEDTQRQIDSIWVYLMEIDHGRLPVGMEAREAFEIVPRDRPVVFRTFFERVSTRAIAVGFPAGVHAVFDATDSRLGLVWRGRFLDAESKWKDRFTPPTRPLGEALLYLPQGPSLTSIATSTGDREVAGESLPRPRFEGYRLRRDGSPTFLYRWPSLEVSDTLQATSSGALRRTFEFRGELEAAAALRLIAHERLQRRADDVWQAGSSWRVRVEAPTGRQPIEARTASTHELLWPLDGEPPHELTVIYEAIDK